METEETYGGKKDYSGYVGAGAIALGAVATYEGVKQLGKRVIIPAFGKAKKWVGSHLKKEEKVVEEAEVVNESEEK
jgi:hypothetical protein